MTKEIEYNKLVRDNIIDIIKQDGKECSFHRADDRNFRVLLIKKLSEELEEFEVEPSLEEAADILEVVYSLFEHHHLHLDKIEEVRRQKLATRGGFRKQIILEKVYEE